MTLNRKKLIAYIILVGIILYSNYLFIKGISHNSTEYSNYFVKLFFDLILVIIISFILFRLYSTVILDIKQCRGKNNYKKLLSGVFFCLIIGLASLWFLIPKVHNVVNSMMDLPRAINNNPIVDNEYIISKYSWTKVIHGKTNTAKVPMITIVTDKNNFSFEDYGNIEFLTRENLMVTIYYLPHTKTVLKITKIKDETW